MMQTIEAVIDENGKIHFLESFKMKTSRRVLVTILPVSEENENRRQLKSLAGLGEIMDDDLETASREIAENFKKSLEVSARDLEN